MAFSETLYEKLTELRAALKQRYASDFGFIVTEDGGLALEERTSPEYDSRKQAEAQLFFFDVEMLCGQIMQYDSLDPAPYRRTITALGVDHNVGEGAPSWTTFGFLDQTVDLAHMAGVLGLIDGGEWQGRAAGVFEENFVKQFFVVLASQRKALYELALLIEFYHQATTRVQQDLVDVIDNGISALRGRQIHMDGFGVVSTIASVAGLIAFPELSLAAAIDWVSLGTGFLSVLATAEDPVQDGGYTIEGDDAPAILASISRGLRRLDDAMDANDREIADQLCQALDSVSSFRNPQLELVYPFTGGSPDFGRMWLSADADVPIENDQVVVSLVDLYEAAQRHIPDTALLYDAAKASIAHLRLPKKSYLRHWRRSREYAEQVVDRLVEIFRRSHDALIDVSDTLTQIATDYELTDCQSAEFNRQIAERFSPTAEGPVGYPV